MITPLSGDLTVAALRPTLADFGQPRLRGLLHGYGFYAALAGSVVLVTVAAGRPGPGPVVSTLIYCVTVCGLFAVSGLYHRRVWSERGYQLMRRLDHAMIFILIAGTATPFCALLLSPGKATTFLSIVWGGGLVGGALSVAWPRAPRSVSAPLYLALGWVTVVILPDIADAGGVATLVMVTSGGLIYTVGAILFALRRPILWPRVFGHHEFFHACTLVAAVCLQVAVYFAVFAKPSVR